MLFLSLAQASMNYLKNFLSLPNIFLLFLCFLLLIQNIAIGNPLILSPNFPLLYTVRESFLLIRRAIILIIVIIFIIFKCYTNSILSFFLYLFSLLICVSLKLNFVISFVISLAFVLCISLCISIWIIIRFLYSSVPPSSFGII